ncbi:MAG TPA: molybdopterin cofactor-binding domain-containing protein [Patescibacteria group bacterium]|nr:molybdopterin cofactor-binding domain-containing protein [Patescibacteria group bacterium]
MSKIENVSRRGFLRGLLSTGALVLSVPVLRSQAEAEAGPAASALPASIAARAPFHPSVFLGIETYGTVYIIAARSEMGTGITTSLPRVVADELDADWRRVQIRQAPGDPQYGDQDTDGSHSVRSFFEIMRVAGATARQMLLTAAANQWGVPVADCATELHEIVYRPAAAKKDSPARRSGYGELAAAAAKLPVPPPAEVRLKPRSAWIYIGKDAPYYNLEKIVTGQARYGYDAEIPGMLFASIEHPPVLGGKAASHDDTEAMRVAGVKQTVELEGPQGPGPHFQPLGGVAVIAENTWAAFQGRKKLKIHWDNGPNAGYNSGPYKQQLMATARQPGKVARVVGDVDAEFAKGGRVVEAEYYAPHLSHAPMEPPAALADFRDGKVTIWAPTQDPQGLQAAVAQALKIGKEEVICHVTLLGGGFGRKSFPDFAVEAAVLSKRLGAPVKVCWSREDDIQFDYYHSVAAMYMKASLDAQGKPTAWLARSVFPPIGSTFNSHAVYGGRGELAMGWTTIPFDLPNLRVENGPAAAHVRIGWLRSVANVYHAFAVQSFAAELAHAAGRDPLEYLLMLIGPNRTIDFKGLAKVPPGYALETGRMKRVVELAADQAGWGKRKLGAGVGMGIAVHWSFLTYVATVVEAEVSAKGDLKILRVDTAVDAGTIVNPAAVRAQFEGAAIFGTSLALHGEITAAGGAIVQSNFQDYPVARINQAPRETRIHLVDSTAPPAGVGEPGVPPFAPALCNAVFAATGKRIRELPLSKHFSV